MIDHTTALENRPFWLRLSRLALGSALLVGGGLTGLGIAWDGGPTAGFLVGVATTLVLTILIVAWVCSRTPAGASRPLTGATWITIARASGLAILGGFLVVGIPDGSAGWLPGALFALVAVLDAVDGPVARATNTVSKFGGRLDTEVDALTVLVGSTLVVANGLAPSIFLVAGLARYAFVAGIALRRARSRRIVELDDNRIRGPLGALVLCAIWLALLPVPGPSVTRPLVILVFLPFAGNFCRDWFVVSGQYRPR